MFVDMATEYCQQVVDGEIPACKWVRLACTRQMRDLERQGTEGFPWVFSEEHAEHVCRFMSLLPHIKGRWARERRTIELSPWQAFIFTTVFGWVDPETGLRRFRTVYLEVPRKNAKSTKSSGVALYLLQADGEEGAEVYSAATTRDQAKIVWNDARRMVEKSPGMQRRFGVKAMAHSISVEATSSYFKALARDQGGNLDGLNVHGAVIDELHGHKTRDVWDVIETATGSRDQPLIWAITTAGFNRAGICYEQRIYVTKVLNGLVEDESYFGCIWTLDEEDLEDWSRLFRDPALWEKANPNWGVSVSPEDIERKALKAAELSSAQNNFLTKHLNVWVNADSAWLDMAKLERCSDASLQIEDFEGVRCFGGLDLASKLDVASNGLLFERHIDGVVHYYWFCRHYLPEDAVEQSTNSQYSGWMRDGYMIEHPGAAIDQDMIEEDILDNCQRYDVVEYPHDPHQAAQLVGHMLDQGIPMVELRQSTATFNEPMKELEKLIVTGRFHYDGNPVMTWMFSNVVCHANAKEEIYPRKELPENKIDGVIALLLALNRALVVQDDFASFSDLIGNPIRG